MTPSIPKRDISLDVLKSVGIIFMLLGHTGFGNQFAIYISGFHMQLFFIVSGLLLSVSKYNWGAFVKRRFKSLLVPYVFFAIVTILICICANIISENTIFEYSSFLKGIVYSNQGIFPVTGAIWFLQCLFFSSIIAFLIIRIYNKAIQLISIILLLIVSWLLNANSISLPFSIDSAISCSVFIYIGFNLKKVWGCCSPLYEKSPIVYMILIAILFVSSYLLININGIVSPRKCIYSNIILYYVNAVITTYSWYMISCYILNKFSNSFVVKNLNYIGKYSILYLGFNQLVIKGVLLLLPEFLLTSPFLKVTRQIILFILTLILLRIICRIVNRTRLRLIFQK